VLLNRRLVSRAQDEDGKRGSVHDREGLVDLSFDRFKPRKQTSGLKLSDSRDRLDSWTLGGLLARLDM